MDIKRYPTVQVEEEGQGDKERGKSIKQYWIGICSRDMQGLRHSGHLFLLEPDADGATGALIHMNGVYQ